MLKKIFSKLKLKIFREKNNKFILLFFYILLVKFPNLFNFFLNQHILRTHLVLLFRGELNFKLLDTKEINKYSVYKLNLFTIKMTYACESWPMAKEIKRLAILERKNCI